MWGNALRFNKPAITIQQQAQLMIDRGLVVKDRTRLERELRTIGYYRLSAYWLHFEEPAPHGKTRSKIFKQGTRHENVIDHYIFDRKLRLIIMEAIERIEVAVRASWTNRFALAHGSHAQIVTNHFRNPWEHASMVSKLGNGVKRSKEVFITHYLEKYTEPYMPPIWAELKR
jgi:abortive infection bacteriophage resistance protein